MSSVQYICITKANKKKTGCTIITPELKGFRGPNWAKIEADLCVSNMGGLAFLFHYRGPRSDVVVGYTCF